jgi:adenylate cyclase
MITSAFAHYVDPTLVHEIAEKSGEINLGGESRELSILFSDIAGFTTISERLAPMDLFSLMSSYLTRMTGILTSHGGTLDKYIGDAVMGFFGAPLTLADHAKRACATALAMRDALPEFNADITARGLEGVDFRVGIATGEVMVGNIGSYDRWNYTVLGDTVNLASRLEATSKEYGTHIIIA